MKRLAYSLLYIIFPALLLAAGYSIIWDKKGNFLEIKSSKANIYAVNCSSTTSTQILSQNNSRKGFLIYNSGTAIVYLSTYTTTNTDNLFPLTGGSTFTDEGIECYTGVLYGVVEPGQGIQTLRIFEKE